MAPIPLTLVGILPDHWAIHAFFTATSTIGFIALAETFIRLSLCLSVRHRRSWLFFTGLVGLNLLQSAFTGWCPVKNLLAKAGVAKTAD